SPGSPPLRRPADGRLHRRRRQAGFAVMSAGDRVVESPTVNRTALSSALILSGLVGLMVIASHPAAGTARGNGSPPSGEPTLALVGAPVMEGTGRAPIRDAVVTVWGNRILRVGPRSKIAVPACAERRDLSGLTLLPGLIDSHVHLIFALPQGTGGAPNDAAVD